MNNNPIKNIKPILADQIETTRVKKIEKDWNSLWIPKNPGDPGSCIGGVLSKLKKHVDYSDKVWYNKV